MNVLVWYKRDLRVEDHPALCFGAELGAVLPLYIAEPEAWAQPDTSARQWAFVAETLAGLRRDLAGLGAPLVVRVGDAVEVLARLCKQNNITRIVSHFGAGDAWAFARDARVRDWANGAGIEWIELAQTSDELLAPPGLRMVAGIEPGVIPNARALRMAGDDCPHRQIGGRTQGMALLDSFLGQRGLGYTRGADAVMSAERVCSRVSPYLALGAVSKREVALAVQARIDARPGADWGPSLRAFQLRIGARYKQPALDMALPAIQAKGVCFDGWCKGQTGLPYLDACMRYLRATGWINFPARAMLVSVAVHHFQLDWQGVGQVLARRLTDYDPAIHWAQVQRLAGLATQRAQLIDPVKQGQQHDPSGAFTRRWVPELTAVPDAFLQTPWKWPGAQAILGRRYPEPLVDIATAARNARAMMRRDTVVEDVELIEPCTRGGLFFTPRSTGFRRTRAPVAGQLSLDL
ncbi:FAD-binding domain-containing protein [Pseudorhodobacter sp. W20_MBD10_FR17]|uniref:FAD-binding domain-containing protein n=1 Tax=Pseudorhodobacter sp. W20_MBD10_FR17 TaxID=3240266 RepID=UPI003F98201E